MKVLVAELTLETRLLKKRMARPVAGDFIENTTSSLLQRIRLLVGTPVKMEIRAFRSS